MNRVMNFLEIINKYWGIILFLAGAIFHALWTYFRVGEHGTRINKLEVDTDSHGKSIQKIESTLQGMDSKLDILVEGYKKEK